MARPLLRPPRRLPPPRAALPLRRARNRPPFPPLAPSQRNSLPGARLRPSRMARPPPRSPRRLLPPRTALPLRRARNPRSPLPPLTPPPRSGLLRARQRPSRTVRPLSKPPRRLPPPRRAKSPRQRLPPLAPNPKSSPPWERQRPSLTARPLLRSPRTPLPTRIAPPPRRSRALLTTISARRQKLWRLVPPLRGPLAHKSPRYSRTG